MPATVQPHLTSQPPDVITFTLNKKNLMPVQPMKTYLKFKKAPHSVLFMSKWILYHAAVGKNGCSNKEMQFDVASA